MPRWLDPASKRLLHLSLVALLFLKLTTAQAADGPPPLDKTVVRIPVKDLPENVADLRAIQKQVKTVIEKVTPSVVGVQIGNSSGSGVIVSADGIVLTAGHVSDKPGSPCLLIFPDGKHIKGKSLGCNHDIDCGMIQITEEGKWPFVDMGSSADLEKGQWVISIGHPGGFKPGRTPVVRLGRVISATKQTVQTDCTLVGGDSGGPLFDLRGKVVGIHSRIGGTLQSNIHVPVNTYRDSWDKLVKSEEEGGFFAGRNRNRPYLGVRVDLENKKACTVLEVNDNTPAAKAGLHVGDIITKLAGRPVRTADDLTVVLNSKKVDDEVEVEVKRGDDVMTLTLKLGKKS